MLLTASSTLIGGVVGVAQGADLSGKKPVTAMMLGALAGCALSQVAVMDLVGKTRSGGSGWSVHLERDREQDC